MNSKTATRTLLIAIPLFLLGLGIIMIYSSSSIVAAERFRDSAYFLKKQLLFGLIGTMAMFVVMRAPYAAFTRSAYLLWAGALVLLVAVIFPGIGTRAGGAVRWLRFGPLSFQPAELAKLAVIATLACSLSKKDLGRIRCFSIGVLPHLLLVLPACLLILLQPDFGTAMMLVAVMFVMLFVAQIRMVHLAIMGGVASVCGFLLVCLRGYRMERILAFLDPWEHATGSGFQVVQSMLALGSGGLTGAGLGQGSQKLFYLPEPHTDFILAVIGEETGFVGIVVVVVLFALLVLAGLRVALCAGDLFGCYFAIGITSLIGLQTIVNMGVVMGLLPTKGIPLPFVSYGGTSLLINLICVGILLSISEQCNFRTNR